MPTFQRMATLPGPQDSVHAIAFSADAKYLAAVGKSWPFGIIAWDLRALTHLKTPTKRCKTRKYLTCAWLEFKTDSTNSQHVLVLGSLDGQITAWDLNEEDKEFQCTRHPAPHIPPEQLILCLDSSTSGAGRACRGQVVASFADRTVRSWSLFVNGGFNLIFSMEFEEGFLPKTVCIHHETRNIYAFALKGGKRAILHHRSGIIITSTENGCEDMTYVALDQSNDRFVTRTGDGYQLFRASNLCHVRTFEDCATLPIQHPCQVAFVEDGHKIVAGTDQGKVLIFDSDTGHLEQTVMHPKSKMVQTVATCTVSNGHYMAIAGSSPNQTSDVIVWRKKVQVLPFDSKAVLQKDKDPIIFLLHRSTATLLCYAFIGIMFLVFAIVISLPRVRLEGFNNRASLIKGLVAKHISQALTQLLEYDFHKQLGLRYIPASEILPVLTQYFETNILNRLGLQFVNARNRD
ncbi:WD40-repeat-containing domain protein [Lentinula raphanica]|nr:WD40-repeat-containing domain protein [Lentinula raphanica]